MSRPKPRILIEYTDPKSFKTEQILESEAIFAVFYNKKPINLRTVNSIQDQPSKYKKVSFSNPGHAFNLCEKLNKQFKTDKFEVVKLIHGEYIVEGDG